MICAGVCSGISAPAVAWETLGWQWVFESEIEPFPSAVMHHHRPEVPNYGDMTKYKDWPDDTIINLLIGGTPCQSFSVAGLRKGLDDPRGNLALTFIGLVDKYRPEWVVWENVPGVLSSGGGQDFESFIRGMAEIGYFGAWRVLDAQWFGVAQRRRRVFAIFCSGDWRPAAAVLFEPESLRGDSAPSRETVQSVAALTANGVGTCGADDNQAQAEHLIPDYVPEVSPALKARDYKGPSSNGDGDGMPILAHTLRAEHDASEDGSGRGTPIIPVAHGVAIRGRNGGAQIELTKEVANCVRTNSGGGSMGMVHQRMAVRRLTPIECERLQGFPDNYTKIPWRGKKPSHCPDGPRYKALGNSMAVPVVRWIGQRIQRWEDLNGRPPA